MTVPTGFGITQIPKTLPGFMAVRATDEFFVPAQVNPTTGGLIVSNQVADAMSSTADVTLGTGSATSLVAARTNRKQVIVVNLDGAINVRIGDSTITATRGARVGPGQSITLATTAQVFGRAESGTPDVAILEVHGP